MSVSSIGPFRVFSVFRSCKRVWISKVAQALELDHGGDPSIGDGEVRWAIEHVTSEVREAVLQMPARQAGDSRLVTILYELDAGIRGRTLPQDA